MNKLYPVIEHIHVNRDLLTESEIWRAIDLFPEQDLIDVSDRLLRFNSGLPGAIVVKMAGIGEFYRTNLFLTPAQHRFLARACIDHWHKLDFTERLALDL
jgi:hypothetical protein